MVGGSTAAAVYVASANSQVVVGQPIGYSGSVLDVVPMPPDAEVVSAAGTWAGIGAMNLQVLASETNSTGERMTALVIEAMLDDDAVKPALDTLKLRVLCGELTFHPSVEMDDHSDDGETSTVGADPKEAQWAADFCKRAHDNLDEPIPIWGWDILDALAYGNKAAEKVLEEVIDGPDAGLYTLKALKVKRKLAYHLCTDPYLNLIALYCQTVVGPAYIDKDHFAVFSWAVRDADPRGSSIFRAAKDPWRRKRRATDSRSKGDDQFGTPSTAMELPEDAPLESPNPVAGQPPIPTTQAANIALQQFQNGSTLVHGHGGKVYVVESERDGTQINSSLDDYDRKIARSILLSAKATMDAKHYTQGGGEIGDDLIDSLADFIRDWFLGIVRKQVFHYLLKVNFGKVYADMYTPRITIGAMPVDDFMKLASPMSLLGQASLLTPSQLTWLLSRAGMPRPLPGELRIGPSGPVPETLTAPAGAVETQEGNTEELPPAPAPQGGAA
jgi:hypothetical protein